jgi:hypothetical protein
VARFHKLRAVDSHYTSRTAFDVVVHSGAGMNHAEDDCGIVLEEVHCVHYWAKVLREKAARSSAASEKEVNA